MISRYSIALNGVLMEEIDENLLILDIGYEPPTRNVKKTTVANLPGYEISDTYIGQRNITVSFELHIYDIAERNAACQRVNEWAKNGGVLVTNDREGQHIEAAVCEQYADISSARNWTDPLTLVFATSVNPYWVSDNATVRSMTGKNTSGTFSLDGNVGSALVSAEVTANAMVNNVQITIGSTMLKFTGLGLALNQKLIVDYINGRYLRVTANGQSVMAKLDPTSSDNLLAGCGMDTPVSVNADANATTVLSARGCWL